ncbi:MAG TPA: DNA repair protein RecO [candidate division Zixibacteria bacterium]|nr:DNA repair protein RecO [candidate division Zixibacteria bacterium]
MEIARFDSIVLKRLKFGDTSLIATLLTRERGKMSVIAKGARSPKSNRGLASALEPLNRIEATVYAKPTRTMQVISSAEILDDFHAIKSDFDRITAATLFAKHIERMTFEEDACARTWDALLTSLTLLASCELDEVPSLRLRFRAEILSAGGLAPIVESCSLCGDILGGGAKFSAKGGGIRCEKCGGSGITLDETDIALLKALFANAPHDGVLRIPEGKLKKIEAIIEHHERFHYD